MVLKDYQIKVVNALKDFFTEAEKQKSAIEQLSESLRDSVSWVDAIYNKSGLSHFADRPRNGLNKPYPRFCLKVPTAGGKTLIAIETIRQYQNLFAKKRTGCVVWITHRETIYKQTIEKLRDKNHVYRQWLDQCSGNRTLIIEKGHPLRLQDVEENLVILMLMIQSARMGTRENMKVFQDSGGYIEFFPPDNQYNEHENLIKYFPNLETFDDSLFHRRVVKTSLGNAIRMLNPLMIVDEFHTMFSEIAKQTLDSLNPSVVIGLSATPKERRAMNIFIEITGQELKKEQMIKLDLHLHSPTATEDWHEMINQIKQKREALEKEAIRLNNNRGIYIRPIVLIQAERTGRKQRGRGYVHSEDVREYLIERGIPAHQIAVKSSELDEIKEQKLLSDSCEIRYIITKEALKEGWDCSFAYILGVTPSARTESSMTQLVGRILRQPYAKKTGISDLDESYVYFTKGETEDVLRNVQRGFKEEGLEDLFPSISPESGPTGSRKIKTKVKPDILKKYPESLFLPVWTIKKNNHYRKFSYEIDIKSRLNWAGIDYSKWLRAEIFSVFDNQSIIYEYLVDLYNKYEKRQIDEESAVTLEVSYLARRINDVVENAFVSVSIAQDCVNECKKYKDYKKIQANSGFITNEIIKKLSKEKENQEKIIFDSLIKEKKLILSVSPNDEMGYSIPQECEVYPEYQETFRLNLFQKSDFLSMNSLEKHVARLIDDKESVLWWMRNRVDYRYGFAIRAWKKGRIFPDFIVAKKNRDNSIEIVYVIESKGEHLIGSANTQYKKNVFETMNKEKVEPIILNTVKLKMNNKFGFELVEQGQEELMINRFFNL